VYPEKYWLQARKEENEKFTDIFKNSHRENEKRRDEKKIKNICICQK
jgi:hypothetical protein